MADLYDKSVLIGQQERQQFTAPQTGQPARGATAPAMSQQASEYLDSLEPAERQAAMERMQAPLNGEDIAEALKRDPDFVPTHPEYLQYVAYNKTHESSIIDGISEGAGAVLNDLGAAVSAVADHPMKALVKAPTSLIEAFAQGTRNLYGMLAQSANPDSVLFGFKNAIAGDGSPEGYNQFLEARKFNKHSARLASGEDTIVMDKDVIDHDMTLAMSYIADPTLFIPFGAAATAGMKAVGLGEKMVMLGGRASALKAAVIGGGLKWAVGAPIEFIGGTTRAVIDRAVAVGGNVLETATGISAAELKATARLSAVGTTTADLLGGHIPVVSNISNIYLGAGAAAGIGETIGAVGEQIMKQGGKRGNLSFARAALESTPNLSSHARGLLKVLDAVDPLMSYGYSMAEGMGHGAAIGGTLGYLSGGEEGFGHGIGAGMALGGTGALAGRAFADISGGTRLARAEVQGEFNLAIMKANGDPNYKGFSALLLDSTLKGDRAGALQAIGGLDRVSPNLRMIVGSTADAVTLLKEHGLNKDGFKINKDTGHLILDAEGNPVKYGASIADWHGGEGFVMFTDMDASGKKQVTIHINTDASRKTTLHHEIFHAAFRSSVMETFFKDGFSHAILGKYDETGKQVKPADISPAEFRKFVTRELRFTRDANGNQLPAVEVHKMLKQFDAHLAEYQKLGSRGKMNPESARALDNMVEEFGAHYFTQFLKGKSVDYLFHGAEFSGMRGVVDRLHNNFLDFWQTNVSKQRPTFDFSKGFDTAFGTNGKRTMAQRVSSIDYLAQDMLRANAGKRKGSSNSVDVRALTPEARTAFFEGNGIDGLKHFYDKFGKPRNLTEAQVKQEKLDVGKAVHEALSKLDPKDTAGLIDVDGNFGASSTLGTRFNDTMLAHLVKEGHITQLLADRIRAVQDIVSGKGSNVVSYLYHGESQETQVGPNSPRRYGADVPITARNTIVVGYDIKVKKDGTMSLVMKGLDKNIIDARGNTLWSDSKVRDLWQGDRNAFDQSFFDYLSNASKASTDNSRVESSLIPSLARGDGFGGERRNVMHQFLGMAKRKSESYFNTPIAEIPRGKTSTVFNSSMDLMTPMESNLPTRYDFNLDNAHRDLSKNFKVSDMEAEKTPVGNIFTHASGYKITSDANGAAHLYDSNGKSLGAFKDKDLASVAMEKAYAAERVEVDKRIERVKESQDKQQTQFKVWDDETLAKGRALGDIFETDAGKAFHQGTTLIRQTREEFFSDNFIKLRQSDPETVMQITEQIAKRGYSLRDLRTKAYDRVQAELAKGRGRDYMKARDEYDVIVAHADRYNDILLAYERATKSGRNGQAILDYINTHRRTSTGYDNMAKIFFGDAYDSQFQTGKPVTTVATHGTNSNELLTSRQFDPAELGSRHGSDKDKVGVFLSGETKTSMGYADPKTGDTGYRQVRAAIKFNNPFVVDFNYDCFAEYKYEKIFNQAKAGGHDGVIIKNVYDGGSADTVFVVMADKVKDNTAIIDTHLGMDKVDTESRGLLEYDQGAVRYPIQESMPRGKDVRVGNGIGLSWKVADGVARESGFDKFLKQANLSGRLRKGVNSEEFAGRPVVLINYDNSGVWNLIDSTTGEVISTIQGGALHNVISGKINPDKQAAVLASVNSAGLKGIEAVRQKAIKSGKPLTFLIISGNETKSFSHPQVGGAVTSLLAKFIESKAIDPKEVNTLIKAMSEAFSTKEVKNEDGTKTRIKVPQGDLLKPLIGRPVAEQIAFLQKEFFPQDKSTFSNRGETMDRLAYTLAELPSVNKNKDYFQKFFNNPEMKMSGKDFIREILKLTDEPITRGANGESLGYGKIIAALEVPHDQAMETKAGGHSGFPMDYRSDAGKGKTTPAVMSVFEVPRRITDMVSPPHGRDVNPHYISKSGKIRSSSELIMNTTSTFGEGVVRESSHDMRKDNLSKATTKEKTLAGKPAFKVRDKFYSPLEKAVEGIFRTNVGNDEAINPARLLNLIKNASGGNLGKIMTEAQANGLVEFLKSGGQTKMPISEIREYLKENRIEVRVDEKTTNVDADFGSTTEYIATPYVNRNAAENAKGNVEQHTIVLRTNAKYSHGHKGHFGEAIMHIRGTMREDASGRSVFFVEEIQPQNAMAENLTKEQRVEMLAEVEKLKTLRAKYAYLYPDSEAQNGGTYTPTTIAEVQRVTLKRLLEATNRGDDSVALDAFKKGRLKEQNALKGTEREKTAGRVYSDEFIKLTNDLRKSKDSVVRDRTIQVLDNLYAKFAGKGQTPMLDAVRRFGVEGYAERIIEGMWYFDNEKPHRGAEGSMEENGRPIRFNEETGKRVSPPTESFRRLVENVLRDEVLSKAEMTKEYNTIFPASESDLASGIRHPHRSIGIGHLAEQISNKSSKAVRENNNAPLQEFGETTRLASRAIMQKAIELGADRVAFVRSKDTHPDVSMRNARGEALYDRSIPDMVGGELKKFGAKLEPANDISNSKAIPTSDVHDQHTMLSESLGYDINGKMIGQDAWNGQPTYKVADEGNRGSVLSRMESKTSELTDLIAGHQKTINRLKDASDPTRKRLYQEAVQGRDNAQADLRLITEKKRVVSEGGAFATSDYGMLGEESSPNVKPFEGNFKVNDVVKKGVNNLSDFIDKKSDTDNLSPDIKNAVKALREAVAKQEATDEVLVPELREAYDKIVASVEEGISRPALTPVETLKELQKILKPLDKKIDKNSERIQKNSRDAVDKDMAEGSDLESDQNSQRQGEYNQSQNEGADLEAEQAFKQRGDYTEDMNDGAGIESDTPRNQNLPKQFPYPAPETPAGLPSYKPSGTPAFPRPPARPATPRVKPSGKPAFPRPPTTPDLPRPTPSGKPAFPSPPSTPALPQVKPNNKPAFPRPPTAPAVPRGSIASPPPRGSLPDSTFPNLPPSKPVGKLEGWRGWTLEKGLNGGFWKNAVGWMIVVQADKFKVYNPEKAMLGIYQDLNQAKRRVQRAEPKQ